MEIELLIKKKKDIYSFLVGFIDGTENIDFKSLITIFEKYEILEDQEEIISTFKLLSKISDHHHRFPYFVDKFRQIIQYLTQNKRFHISDFEIYDIFKNNKLIILNLLEQEIIRPDEKIISDIMERKDTNNFPYSHYLYSGIKTFIDDSQIKSIENEIKEKYEPEITKFEEKCRIGENDIYICSLIRQDLIEEFISYTSRTNTPLSKGIIPPSIFETNSFLMKKKITLIEYASFFGSIQIVQYLKYNNVRLANSLWYYVIHSNNAELIHFLEENEVRLLKCSTKRITYKSIYKESIICHHNEISDYIKYVYLDNTQIDCFGSLFMNCYNYYQFPSDIGYIISRPKNENGFNMSNLCLSLTHITIPISVTSIGKSSFAGLSSLTQIIIPSSVISIRNYAFYGCSSLTQISIPSSVTSIGDYSFYGCTSLAQILIPSSVTSIGNSSFSKCSSLTQILIPSSVTSIGDGAFFGCSSLKLITISSAISFGKHVFDGIKSLIITGNIQKIPNKMLNRCYSLTQISIPSSVTSIGDHTFSVCASLAQILIPSSVTSIGNSSFSECSLLTQILIPSSVTSIGDNAFYGCSSLKQITISSSEISFGQYVFDGIKSLIITGDIQTIPDKMFCWCSLLEQITIPPSLTSIGNDAFYGCSSLAKIEIPSSVTSIGKYAFFGCSSLAKIEIPSSVTSIGKYAFDECLLIPSNFIPTDLLVGSDEISSTELSKKENE